MYGTVHFFSHYRYIPGKHVQYKIDLVEML